MRRAAAAAGLMALAACAGPDAVRLRAEPAERLHVASCPLGPIVSVRGGPTADDARPLFVFIEGDGAAWTRSGRPPHDPTPARAIALELARASGEPFLYLGRPCQFASAATRAQTCTPESWTTARYAPAAARCLADMVARARAPGAAPPVLVGYSGGSVMAIQAAALVPTGGVITLAGNLDVSAWSQARGDGPAPSGDVIARAAADLGDLPQLVVVGGRDSPPIKYASRRYVKMSRGRRTNLLVIENADHEGPWPRHWPDIISLFHVMKGSDVH